MRRIELVSPLPADECVARLLAVTGSKEGFLPYVGPHPVVGHISGRSVRLRKRLGWEPLYMTRLVGRFEQHEAGSVFRGRVRIHGFWIVFYLAWCGVPVGALSAASWIASRQIVGLGLWRSREGLILLLFPLFLVVLPTLGYQLFKRMLRPNHQEGQFLVDYVARIIGSPSPDDSKPKTGPKGAKADLWSELA